MNDASVLFAKAAALNKNFREIDWGVHKRTDGNVVDHLLKLFDQVRKRLASELPELFGDMIMVPLPEPWGKNDHGLSIYLKMQFEPIIQNLDYILEVRPSYRIGQKHEEQDRPKRIFISHGRNEAWRSVQSYIEKDLALQTLELAQEANQGRTVLQKLNDEAGRCGFAVIVMTGDDMAGEETRARENVMHEIGFFQGKYGLQNIALLHEEGVNIPSNIQGLVYISFPKDMVKLAYSDLQRELKVFYG